MPRLADDLRSPMRPSQSEHPEPRSRTVLLGVLVAQSTGTLPIFLAGSLAVLIRTELGFSAGRLGIAVSLFLVTSALIGVPAGSLCDRLGPLRSLTVSIAATAVILLSMATLARSWLAVAVLLALAGAANAMTQPSTNLAIARGVARNRGLAFGVKQAAVPLSTMLAGASVPVIGVTVGWRWAFVVAAMFVVLVIVVVRRLIPESLSRPPADTGLADAPLNGMVMLSIAVVFANATVTAMGAFFVESAVDRGIDAGASGLLLMLGSGSAIVGRVLSGVMADRRRGDHVRSVVIMMSCGVLGYLLLSAVQGVALMALAAVVAFGFGWGWNGLFHFVTVSLNPRNPARATGIAAVGLRVGGIVGPSLFGGLAEAYSFETAWRVNAALMVLGALLLLVARGVLRRGGAAYEEERKRA
jgi:MFS family permease